MSCKKLVAVVWLVIQFMGCSIGPGNPETAAVRSNCSLEGFTLTEAENRIIEIEDAFVVRKIRGWILNYNDIEKKWPVRFRVLFELRQSEGNMEIMRTIADENGYFEIPNVPEGRYCFKATLYGWETIIGTIIVDKKADEKIAIVLNMTMA